MHKNNLEIIIGPVACGKSEELIRRIVRYKIAKFNVLLVKPVLDTRNATIKSRNGTELEAIALNSIRNIWDYLEDKHKIVAIDEAQFFSTLKDDLYSTVRSLLRNNKKVIISALDTDFHGNPFGEIPRIITLANQVTKLNAICMVCHSDNAIYSQKLRTGGDQIEVGDLNLYEPRCLNCFTPGGIAHL